MSLKTSADVLIGGKIYTLSGYESEEYLQKVASYINSKLSEIEELEQFRRLHADMKSTLLELNIADDYFKAKEQAEKLEQAVREKEREIYELQHDLISAKIRIESSEKNVNDLEQENKELLLNKAKLEASLADALLGKVKGQAATGHESLEEKESEQNLEHEKQEVLKKSFSSDDKQKNSLKNSNNERVTQEK
ncbi:MAG: cell division protein ZapA [Lachnospiraceae bacterium]|nr:cell division protein ZapA [Lachnospiraceae bacterium]